MRLECERKEAKYGWRRVAAEKKKERMKKKS